MPIVTTTLEPFSPSPKDAAPAEGIKAIILALDRSLRSQRLYAATHPVLLRHRQELLALFSNQMEAHGDVELRVDPFRFFAGETVVYSNENQQESFAFRLFNDGIRSLAFRPGLTEQELGEFLEAMASTDSGSSDSGASDSVTRFWEKEFDHIRYSVADALIDEPTVDEKTTDEKVEEILDPKMNMYRGAGEESDEDAYQATGTEELKITLNMNGVGEMFSNRVVLTENDLKAIQEDLTECEQLERLALDFVDMVLAVLQEENDKAEFEKTLEALGTVLDHNLLQGEIRIASMIMEAVHDFPRRPIQMAKLDPALLSWTLKILWPAARIDLLFQSLSQQPKGTAEDVEKLFCALDPSAVPFLLNRVPSLPDPGLRQAACRGIAALHKGDVGLFARMLASREPQVVQSALEVLSHLKNEKVLDLIIPFIARGGGEHRKGAIELLSGYPNPKSLKLLYGLLDDPSEEIRTLALKTLSSATDKEAARQVLAYINRPDFDQKSFQERKAFFHCVAKIAKDDFIPHLENVLNMKVWFRKPEVDEQYRLAAYGLEMVGSRNAIGVLEAGSRSKNNLVRLLCENAMRHLR
jgi:hypothetical protein